MSLWPPNQGDGIWIWQPFESVFRSRRFTTQVINRLTVYIRKKYLVKLNKIIIVGKFASDLMLNRDRHALISLDQSINRYPVLININWNASVTFVESSGKWGWDARGNQNSVKIATISCCRYEIVADTNEIDTLNEKFRESFKNLQGTDDCKWYRKSSIFHIIIHLTYHS